MPVGRRKGRQPTKERWRLQGLPPLLLFLLLRVHAVGSASGSGSTAGGSAQASAFGSEGSTWSGSGESSGGSGGRFIIIVITNS